MFELEDKLANNEEYVKARMTEQFNQRLKTRKYIVKMPCHNANVELERPEDAYVECPTCHKHYLVSYSANRSKVWSAP